MTAGRQPRSPKNRWGGPFRLVLRLVVMGIGLGVVTGTSLKLLAPPLAEGASKRPRLDLGTNSNKKGRDPGQF